MAETEIKNDKKEEPKNFEYIGGSLYRFKAETEEHTQMTDITEQVQEIVTFSGTSAGLCMVYVPHTTAAVAINENADPDVQKDIKKELEKIVPWNDDFAHSEGNSAAHVKATLTGPSESVIVRNRKLLLGQWQGIYLMEFDGPRERTVYVKVMSDGIR